MHIWVGFVILNEPRRLGWQAQLLAARCGNRALPDVPSAVGLAGSDVMHIWVGFVILNEPLSLSRYVLFFLAYTLGGDGWGALIASFTFL
ncbi:hypothetical protein Caka_1290 [Coraliomargarita akajimensis DSM 45221]|uniref:Uncharacterized protein n=1 Tax=Coraliomargarita akajimensis (strain DSM 45221 / IAM 15411 / JCM 23193 / KCTC 12865 / 04OKA010-24) TaxID=583355 RepID=D5EIR1_CORAD|nr:hypothetical protein Caka_1290 [Coraliomargarita akajimensis DSM 45221]